MSSESIQATANREKRLASSQDNTTAAAPVKRTRRLLQPDVVVVVGGKEFHHYCQKLCFVSEYFHAALHSGMCEEQNKRFDSPTKILLNGICFCRCSRWSTSPSRRSPLITSRRSLAGPFYSVLTSYMKSVTKSLTS